MSSKEFQQFALSCARAFCSDEYNGTWNPVHNPISENEYAVASREYHTHLNLSPEEQIAYGQSNMIRLKKYYEDGIAERTAESDKHKRLLSEATRWVPPTPRHQPFKHYMIEELNYAIYEFDTKFFIESLEDLNNKTAIDLYNDHLKYLKDELEHATKALNYYDNYFNKTQSWLKELQIGIEGSE